MLNTIDTNRRTLGVTFPGNGEAQVLLWAPLAGRVALKTEDGAPEVPLAAGEYGYWSAATYQVLPGSLYKFVLDGEKERPDPVSMAQPDGVHGSSRAYDEKAFAWTDGTWNNIPLEEYVLYELHTGTFTPEGTFRGLEEKLDYLIDLGVNAIEIMPVAQFPGTRNWGYDGVLPYAVQYNYGGAEGLQRLVDACHAKGLAVVLDVVYNHMGPEGNYLGDFAPYFTDKYHTPWGNALNFDDAWCDGVRRYFIENALMWFRDFHIDALRLDAVHAIKDLSANHLLREIKEHADRLMAQTGRRHYFIAESDLNDTRYINPVAENGYGIDCQWIDEFHHALRVTAGGERSGYYSDFTGIGQLAKAYRDAYVYDGIYSPHRQKTFGGKAAANPGKQFVVFSQNHDQVGNRMLGERTSTLVSPEMQKLLAGAVLTSPYLPMLFMGEEWSEPNPFQYFVSHTDEELAKAVRKGREAEFAAFHNQGEAPDPMAENTFRHSSLQWHLLGQEPHRTILEYYKTLIALRKQHPALKHTDRHQLSVECDTESNTLVLHRWHEDQQMVCLMNFSGSRQPVALPALVETWHKVLDSADPRWGGPGAAPHSVPGGSGIDTAPESLTLYTNRHA